MALLGIRERRRLIHQAITHGLGLLSIVDSKTSAERRVKAALAFTDALMLAGSSAEQYAEVVLAERDDEWLR